ncbi:glycine cleavage system protein H [Planctomycetales bacterium ZRK34]|nr:glycine cleavage system protein H [Planctomycetales bacterium ZRK34]
MTDCEPDQLRYHRSRFSARLPLDRLYSRSHYWLSRQPDGTWRIGLTRFAKRMLGDIVEFEFTIQPDAPVQCGQEIGWIEAFKAVSDIFCVAEGRFLGVNQQLADDPALIDSDPHGDGWLYTVDGQPDPQCVDAQGYTQLLDAHIDKMLGETTP